MDQWTEFNKNNICQKTDIFNFKTVKSAFPLESHAPHVHPLIRVFITMYFNYLVLTQYSPLGLWGLRGQGF